MKKWKAGAVVGAVWGLISLITLSGGIWLDPIIAYTFGLPTVLAFRIADIWDSYIVLFLLAPIIGVLIGVIVGFLIDKYERGTTMKSKKLLFGILGVCVLVIIGFGLFYYSNNQTMTPAMDEIDNISEAIPQGWNVEILKSESKVKITGVTAYERNTTERLERYCGNNFSCCDALRAEGWNCGKGRCYKTIVTGTESVNPAVVLTFERWNNTQRFHYKGRLNAFEECVESGALVQQIAYPCGPPVKPIFAETKNYVIFVDENYTTEKYDVKVKRDQLLDNLKNYFSRFSNGIEKCSWCPPTPHITGPCEKVVGYYFDYKYDCVALSGCEKLEDIPFDSLEECKSVCERTKSEGDWSCWAIQQERKPGELVTEAPKSPAVTIIVIDAITKQPIEKASVELREVVYHDCPEVVYSCPKGLLLKKETNKEGKAVFYDNKLKEQLEKASFMITVSAENYSSATKLSFGSKGRTIVIELIGGDIAVKTRETAISYAKKDSRLINWLSKHPNAHSYPVVEFVSPYWTVEYNDKTTCEHYDPTDINCAIIVKIDARNGEIIEVLPE